MARLSKESLLGASDLREKEVDLPSIGGSVLVRSLPAAYSNQAQSEATELKNTPRGEQFVSVNVAKLEALQVLHGLVEPRLNSLEEAEAFAAKCGPAWAAIVTAIDELSGIDKEAIKEAEARFPSSNGGSERDDVEAAAPAGSG